MERMRGNKRGSEAPLRTGRAAGAVCLALLVAACGGGADGVKIDGEAGPPASSPSVATTSPTPSAPAKSDPGSWEPTAQAPGAPADREFTRGRNGAKDNKKQQAVAESWYLFYEELVRAYTTPVADRGLMEQVATGDALEGTLDHAEELTAAGHRDVGGLTAGVTSVTVDGDEATVRGCLRSTMIRTDAGGTAMQEASPWYTTEDLLVREGGAWKMKRRYVDDSVGCLL